MDILPRLKKGVLVEFHDICLPYDYPEEWINRYYSEQYGLACYRLAEGDKFEIVLPNKFVVFDHELMSGLNELWNYGNPGKIVIAPRKWFARNDMDTRDLIPESWIRI
jgi:hypothetical protein